MTTDSIDFPRQKLSWPRIAGTAFAIALHVVVFLMLSKLGRVGKKTATTVSGE